MIITEEMKGVQSMLGRWSVPKILEHVKMESPLIFLLFSGEGGLYL